MSERNDLINEAKALLGRAASAKSNYFSATARLNGDSVTVIDVAYIDGSALVAQMKAQGKKVEFRPEIERAYAW
jgi:hypothetical protein